MKVVFIDMVIQENHRKDAEWVVSTGGGSTCFSCSSDCEVRSVTFTT